MRSIHFAGAKVTVDTDRKAYNDRREQLGDVYLEGFLSACLTELR